MRYKYVKVIETEITAFFVLQLVIVTKLRRHGTGTNSQVELCNLGRVIKKRVVDWILSFLMTLCYHKTITIRED